MKISLVASALLLSCAHGSAPRPPPRAAPGELEGLVVDPRGVPVEGAVVALVRPGAERPEALTRSDGAGHFRFYERAAGDFCLTATSPEGAASFLGPQPLAAGASRSGLRLALEPGGFAIRGAVQDRGGRPFPLARVLAARIGAERGDLFATFADAAGRYELRLGAGSYLVFAEGDGHGSRNPARAVPGGAATVDLVLDPVSR